MVNLYYLLIAVMPLENHWLWRFELLGNFTVLKALALVCLCGAVARIAQKGLNPQVLRSWPIRCYLAYLAIQCGSFFIHGGDLDVSPWMYQNVLSIIALAVVTLTFID